MSGDGEKTFKSNEVTRFYKSNNIKFIDVPRIKVGDKTEPMHSSLGLIDRVVRTLRDMSYVMNIHTITPDVMVDLVNQYNHAPHKTLTKYAGHVVSPHDVQFDNELENKIVRKICQNNYVITHSYGYKIPNNMNVNVFEENDRLTKRRSVVCDGDYIVVGRKNYYYIVKDLQKNITFLMPRFKLDPVVRL